MSSVVVVIGAVVILGTLSGGYVLTETTGIIPSGSNLDLLEPKGNMDFDADEYIEEYGHYWDIINDVPNINKLNYQVFESSCTIGEIHSDYKWRLETRGFSEEYTGTIDADGVKVSYVGFLKGLTAVGVLMTEGRNLDRDCETVVLYTSGFAGDYQEIIRWYELNGGSI